MSRNFIDEIKHIVEHPLEWPKGSLEVCQSNYDEVSRTFINREPDTVRDMFFPNINGVSIYVDESVPKDEIRFVSVRRNPKTGEYEKVIDKIVNVTVPEPSK